MLAELSRPHLTAVLGDKAALGKAAETQHAETVQQYEEQIGHFDEQIKVLEEQLKTENAAKKNEPAEKKDADGQIASRGLETSLPGTSTPSP